MNTLLGLDIGSHSIKAIELKRDKSAITLLAGGVTRTPIGALKSVNNEELESIAVAIKKLIKDTGIIAKNTNIALPESQVFTRVIDVPQLSSRELTQAIKWEAEQYIPLPLDQVNLDFSVLRDSKQTGKPTMEVLLVAAPKALIEKYLTILEFAGISATGVETEIIATSRSLVRTVPNVPTMMIMSLGAQTTDFAILHNGVLSYTRSMSTGGEALSRALSQTLDFDLTQAEEYKKTYGLETDKLEGKIVAAVKPIMDTIVGEIKRAIAFYQERYPKERVEVILLSGGTARLPGIVVYLAQEVGVETQLANPWTGITVDTRFQELSAQSTVFSVAVGLALRDTK